MRTAVADFHLKNNILIARDNYRHALEDHGHDSVEERGFREILRGALQNGWEGGLTEEDVRRITGADTNNEADRTLGQSIEETRILEGPVLTTHSPVVTLHTTSELDRPKRTRKPRTTKAITETADE